MSVVLVLCVTLCKFSILCSYDNNSSNGELDFKYFWLGQECQRTVQYKLSLHQPKNNGKRLSCV